jgi:adenosylhomocysteine nucleosidase
MTIASVHLHRCRESPNIESERAVLDLLEAFRPEVVIVCGIGGGIEGKDDIATGDVVVATYLHYSEFRKISEDGDHDRYVAYDQPSAMLRHRHVDPLRRTLAWKSRIAVDAPEQGHEPKVLVGPLIAGDKIIGNPKHPEHQRAMTRYTDAIAVDMESYGAGRAMHMYRTRVDFNPLLVVVRGISDIVARPSNATPEEDELTTGINNAQRQVWKPYACAVASAFTAEFSDRVICQPDLRKSLRSRNPVPPNQ